MVSKKGTLEYEKWILTPEYKEFCRKRSVVTTGEKNPFYRKHHTKKSRRQMSKSRAGRITSDETRERLSISLTGRIVSEETRERMSNANTGKNNPQYGKAHSIKWCKNHSLAMSGENNPNWNGGVSFGKYCYMFNPRFKDRVRGFFGYECAECGMTQNENGKKLDVHHVNYDKMVCCNGVKPSFVSLCRSHNAKANFNRAFWEDWYTEIINEFYGGRCYLPDNNNL